MSDYQQLSGTTVDVGLDNFEYEQRSGSTVNVELQLATTLAAIATDSDSGATALTRVRELRTTASDTDSGVGVTTRERSLTASASETDAGVTTIQAAPTVDLTASASDSDAGLTTGQFSPVVDLRTTASDTDTSLTSATRLRNLKTTSVDTDISVAVLERLRNVSARASDLSDATVQLSRLRNLASMASDTDSASTLVVRVRPLSASASDTDIGETVFLPVSVSTDPRQMAIDIVRNTGLWPGAEPEVFKADTVTQKGRENNAHPAIYVQHVDESLTRPSDGEQNLTEDTTVRLDVWVLGDSNHDGQAIARAYRNRVINVFNNYMNDNYARTEFHRIEPSDSTDFRQQHIARQTDHHIYSVEIETHRLTATL